MLTKLSENSEKVLTKRYYVDGEEDWPGLCNRVVDGVVPRSLGQYNYTQEQISGIVKDSFDLINDLYFVPNSPTMFNAGTEYPMLSACFIIDVEDDLVNIYNSLSESAQIHKMGGGVGLSFGKLRGNGSRIATTHGHSRGAVSFLKVFSYGTAEITAAGKRKGANMGQLPVWHCDIEEFIECKKVEGDIANFNITVQLTDAFMDAVIADTDFDLYDPKDMSVVKTVRAKELLDKIISGAKRNGEPGVCFIDRINRDNPTPHIGKITSSNPCQPGWAPVLTPKGIKTFDDIEEGSIIWSGKRWTKVIRKDCTGYKDVYSYQTASGGVFDGTEDHRVLEYGKKVQVKYAEFIDPCSLEGVVSENHNNKIIKVESRGAHIVYDITVDDPEHTYWTNGLCVSNCGEFYSIPYSSCNLGSLNLTKYVKEREFDWDLFGEHIRKAINYLDCIIDANQYPLDKIDKVSKATRPLGLGVMGFADALILMGLRYDSEEAFDFAERLAEYMSLTSLDESAEVAKIKGPYPEFRKENHQYEKYMEIGSLDWSSLVKKINKHGLRNCHTLVIAPTGTIATIANEVSHGIEPLFALSYDRNIMGTTHKVKHGLYKKFLDGDLVVPEDVFVVAGDIKWQDHVEMQARWQKYVHNGISKTINMVPDTSEEDIYDSFMAAYEKGLKGLTVYIEGSRKEEVIVSKEREPEEFSYHMAPKRPDKLECDIFHMQVTNQKWVIMVGLLQGHPYEIFAGLSKFIDLPKKYDKGVIVKRAYKSKRSEYDLVIAGGTDDELVIKDIVEVFSNDNESSLGRLASLSLRHGTKPAYLSEQLLKDPSDDFHSYSKALGRVLKKYITNGEKPETGVLCQECGSQLIYLEGCKSCPVCGWAKCG